MTEFELHNLESLVMHRDPMLLLDKILDHNRSEICARVTVSDRSPGATKTGVPGLVCIEYMAQTIAAHASLITGVRQEGMLLGTRLLTLHVNELCFGQTLHVQATTLFSTISEMGMYDCEVRDPAAGQVIATAKLKVVRSSNLVQFLEKEGQL